MRVTFTLPDVVMPMWSANPTHADTQARVIAVESWITWAMAGYPAPDNMPITEIPRKRAVTGMLPAIERVLEAV